MGHPPNLPCTLGHVHAPDGAGCSTPVIPEEAYRTALAMQHHARGDALEYLGAPVRAGDSYDDGTYWQAEGVAIGASVRDGQPWVDIDFPFEPDDRTEPEYSRQGPADVMERWLLAALAAVHEARARASMEVQ